MPRLSPVALAVASLLSVGVATVRAADDAGAGAPSPERVTVGVRVVPPFVIRHDDGSWSGLTVELWAHIAEGLGIEYDFEERSIDGMLRGVEDGSLFAAAAALTITAERETRVDFTHPFLVTGLGIAVPRDAGGFGAALRSLLSPQLLWVVGLLLALLLFWGLLVWLFERRLANSDFTGTPTEGIGSGFWWAAVTMTTVGYGDKSPKTLGGRVVGFVWMFMAIIVISFFTASIASSLTVTRLGGTVNGPQDLPGARVGVLDGAASIGHLVGDGIHAALYDSIDDGLRAVAEGKLDAFVHDAPILRHHQRTGFPNRVRVLPVTFAEQYYGIALPFDAPIRNDVNRVLLEYLASDDWKRLVRRYLGRDDG